MSFNQEETKVQEDRIDDLPKKQSFNILIPPNSVKNSKPPSSKRASTSIRCVSR